MSKLYTTPNGLYSVYDVMKKGKNTVYTVEDNTNNVTYYVSLNKKAAIAWANTH